MSDLLSAGFISTRLDPTTGILIGRMLLAVGLGIVIGFEREFYNKSAGLRTHILVTFGACLFTMVSLLDFYTGLPALKHLPETALQQDPSRVSAQIVSGIGFIGGGAVLKYGASIRGLTTAASLWNAASIGMLVGTGHYALAIPAAFFTFAILFLIGQFERLWMRKNTTEHNRMQVTLSVNPATGRETLDWMNRRFKSDILEVHAEEDIEKRWVDLKYTINCARTIASVQEVASQISGSSGVNRVQVKTFSARDAD